MATNKQLENKNTAFFITFSCHNWLNLIELSDAYKAFYKWFDYLKTKEVLIFGYVIMPNHFHGIFYLPENIQTTINTLVANGKRFISYDIIKGLEVHGHNNILQILQESVSLVEKNKGMKHKVFRTSSDKKEIFNREMLETKLNYIHQNPCKGKWMLSEHFSEYEHSSVDYYVNGIENKYLTDYRVIY